MRIKPFALRLMLMVTAVVCGANAGELWPKPQSQTVSSHRLTIDPKYFSFRVKGYSSSILLSAFDRYADLIFDAPSYNGEISLGRKHKPHLIKHLDVYVYSFDQSLNLDTDESYTLTVESPVSVLQCRTVYGALRGLETLSQLVDRIDPSLDISISAAGLPLVGDSVQQHPSSFFASLWQLISKGGLSMKGFIQVKLVSYCSSAPAVVEPATAAARGSGTDSDSAEQPLQRLSQKAGTLLQYLALYNSTTDPQQAFGKAAAATEQSFQSMQSRRLNAGASRMVQPDSFQISQHSMQSRHVTGDTASSVSDDDMQDAQYDVHGSLPDDNTHNARHSMPSVPSRPTKQRSHHNKRHKKHRKHKKAKVVYMINATAVSDAPRFRHRGLLLDTSRHFLPVQNIQDHLDAMAWSKMNVFHWHIVDDQSFPYESQQLPRLSRFGAFTAKHTYSSENVADIIAYAKDRGIRVIPEFDTPGHTTSWGKGYPELLTPCYGPQGAPTGQLGPLDPTQNSTYNALWLLLREAAQVFPDSFLHLGGDEVPFDCWQSNPDIQEWMRSNNLGSLSQLESYFESRVLDLATLAGRSYIIWQDVLDNNVTVRDDTVVHVWKWWPVDQRPLHTPSDSHAETHTEASTHAQSDSQAAHDRPHGCQLSRGCPRDFSSYSAGDEPGWFPEMEKVTAQGYRTLLSSPWYLNLGQYYGDDWLQYYEVEPLAFKGSRRQHDLVLGGEACMWGEFTDATNSISATWPRAAAVAERLWSDASVRDRNDAELRLHQHRCRMLSRGLPAQPLGPGFCPQDVDY